MKLGLKMRFNEPFDLPGFTPQMIELHLCDQDMDEHRKEIVDALSILPEIPIVIHSPQNLFIREKKRPLVDMACSNDKQRAMSMEVIRRTFDLAGDVEADYIVVHPGGISHQPASDKQTFLQRLEQSLAELEQDYNTKEILLENMPWFYWMWDYTELWHSNILLTPEDYGPVLEYSNVCLDICHAYLSVLENGNDVIYSFIRELGSRIKHIHLADAAVPDKEGRQFGEGEIDLHRVFRKLLDMDVTAIPEIWGGHENDREGFRVAIQRFNEIVLGRKKKW